MPHTPVLLDAAWRAAVNLAAQGGQRITRQGDFAAIVRTERARDAGGWEGAVRCGETALTGAVAAPPLRSRYKECARLPR